MVTGVNAGANAKLNDLATDEYARSSAPVNNEPGTVSATADATTANPDAPNLTQAGGLTELAWASQKGFYVHQRATYLVIGRQLPAAERKALADAHVIADAPQFQGPDATHRHAMRRPNQTMEAARTEANEFVRHQFSRAWRAETRVEALTEFGLALHALQDSTSPAHTGFQVWSGNESKFQQLEHVLKEFVNPGSDSELYRATEQAWEWFNSGSLPEGNLFIFGCDGCTG